MIKHSKNIPTPEDWCPTLPGGYVRCSVMLDMELSGGVWHLVCLWGGDDLGMEKAFIGADKRDAAKALYEEICGMPEVTFIALKTRGFVPA